MLESANVSELAYSSRGVTNYSVISRLLLADDSFGCCCEMKSSMIFSYFFYNNSFTWEFYIVKSRLAGQMIVVVMKALNKVGIRVYSVIVNPTITILDYVGNCRLCISQLHYYSIHAFKLEDFESSFTSFNKPFVHQFSCGHCSRKRKGHKYMRLD